MPLCVLEQVVLSGVEPGAVASPGLVHQESTWRVYPLTLDAGSPAVLGAVGRWDSSNTASKDSALLTRVFIFSSISWSLTQFPIDNDPNNLQTNLSRTFRSFLIQYYI